MPLRLLRIEPASEADASLVNRGGGAKSSAVNVPDLRKRCLGAMIRNQEPQQNQATYGLGMTARSS